MHPTKSSPSAVRFHPEHRALGQNNHAFKALVDARLRQDIGSWRPDAWLVQGGVWAFGDGFESEWDIEQWERSTELSPYGNSPDRVTPGSSDQHPVVNWWTSGWHVLELL